ncbi:helix-turn-helix domain-containing protein [Ancylobacter sp.]|uniref:helix-turn-helix domain-containing protein n=1 Tax=Ancylobacter sp. TaxID=1872567 RepID=UPI003D0BA234
MTGQRTRPAALREHLSHLFGLIPESILSTSPDCRAPLEMARVCFDPPISGNISIGPGEPGFLVSIQLGNSHAQRVYKRDNSEIYVYNRDTISIRHLSEAYKADLLTPFDFALCYIPCEAINAVAQEMGAPELTSLACPPATRDPVAADLCRALLPALDRPGQREAIFVDSAATAFVCHLAATYGDVPASRSWTNGSLAEWQKRRAIELLTLAAEARAQMSIAAIAAECGLSRSYFVRAFKKSTGLPPHRWLARHRLHKAKHFLSQTDEPIAEVADRCGFADQAHMTRAFASATGLTPAAWRRYLRS